MNGRLFADTVVRSWQRMPTVRDRRRLVCVLTSHAFLITSLRSESAVIGWCTAVVYILSLANHASQAWLGAATRVALVTDVCVSYSIALHFLARTVAHCPGAGLLLTVAAAAMAGGFWMAAGVLGRGPSPSAGLIFLNSAIHLAACGMIAEVDRVLSMPPCN